MFPRKQDSLERCFGEGIKMSLEATPSPVVGKLEFGVDTSGYNLVDVTSQLSKRKYILKR